MLTEKDIQEMRHALEEAERAADMAARAYPGTVPFPNLWEFLDDEGKRYTSTACDRR